MDDGSTGWSSGSFRRTWRELAAMSTLPGLMAGAPEQILAFYAYGARYTR